MKPNLRILSLASIMMSLVTSCVNEGLQEPQDASVLKMISPLEEQAEAVEASMKELHELQTALESNDVKLEGMAAAEQQAAVISKGGASLEEGTLAAFELQKQIARILGPAVASLDSEIYESEFKERFDALELGISKWVGKDFASLYPAALAEAVTKAAVADLDGQLSRQKLYVDALASDVEAGLRNDEKPGELISLAASVQETAANSEKLASELTALASEVEEEYEAAVKSIISDPSGFDGAALKQFNSNVGVELASATNTLESLSARVAACEVQLSAILERLGSLETEIEDLEGLLEMVQSVTFMSEFSEDKAIAYYTMNVNGTADAQGRKPRTGESTMELKWIVRPASAAAALTTSSLWDNGLKVFGYYAQAMTKATGDFFDYDITKVTADNTTGVVTVTVANPLSQAFYFKETGAKLALSLATGNTDLTSKFVEIVPKDKSGTVYVESLTISPESIEIDDNQTAKITAKILPENATNQGVVYTSSNNDIVTVTSDGTVTAKAVGTATITVTASGTDEWGKTLTTTCAVKINSSIKIMGAGYVEEGGQTELRVDSPNYIDSEYVSWEIGTFSSKDANGVPVGFNTNQAFASIDDNGKVSGLLLYYNNADTAKEYVPLMVKCTIAGAIPVVLYHEMRVVAVQPLGISISGLSDTDTQVTTKVGQAVGLYGTIMPTTVNSEYFKVSYLSASDGYFAASSVGATTVTLSVQPGGSGQYNYFYPKGKGLSRNITVNVEPYYVKTLTLPETFEMNIDQTATLTPTFTSDVVGKDPTYQNLKWTSSNPAAVSINETTGEMTSVGVGSSIIRATTSHDNAVPSGQAQKYAECAVTVKKPTKAINIGDYYYSDGSWSTDLESGKTVIGIVFAKVNAAISDVQMINDYPECTNGLVVSLAQYETPMLENGASWAKSIYVDWMNSNGYTQVQDKEKYSGYGTTKGMIAINTAGVSDSYGTVYLDLCEPIIQHRNSVTAPDSSSGWYLPSFKEMTLLYENFDTVNSALESAGGVQMTKQYSHPYGNSTAKKNQGYYCTYIVNDYNNWVAFDMNTSAETSASRYADAYTSTTLPRAEWPVRVILAF